MHCAQVVAEPGMASWCHAMSGAPARVTNLSGQMDLVTGGVALDNLQAEPGGQRTDGLDRALLWPPACAEAKMVSGRLSSAGGSPREGAKTRQARPRGPSR